MKKQRFIYSILITILFVAALASCGKQKPDTSTDTNMSLAVSGGETFEVADGDITKSIVITCSSPAQEDIVVNLETEAPKSEAELTTQTLTIKKNTKTTDTGIKFKLAAFPEKTPEKIILVRISTRTHGVDVEVPTTEFAVSGFIPLVLEGTTNGTEFNTLDKDVEFIITLTLTKPLDSELRIRLTRKSDSSPVFNELIEAHTSLKIDKGQKEAKQTFKIPRGTEGTLEIGIQTTDDDVDIIPKNFSATFITTE